MNKRTDDFNRSSALLQVSAIVYIIIYLLIFLALSIKVCKFFNKLDN